MRKLVPRTLVFAFACAVLGPWGCGDGSEQGAPSIGYPFRPPTGSTYLLAGQSSEHLGAMPQAGFVDGYLDRVPVRPSGISLYGGFPEPNSSEGFGSLAWVQTANDYIALETLDDTIFHFSINWVNEEQAIAGTDEVVAAEQAVLEGKHDAFIDWLADWCSAQRLPILLRLGYEFNVGERSYYPLFTTQGRILDADALWEAWWQPMFDFVEQNADIIGGWRT